MISTGIITRQNLIDLVTSRKKEEASATKKRFVVMNFFADFAAPCIQLNAIFETLANSHSGAPIQFLKCDAEEAVELSELFAITSVPAFVFLDTDKKADLESNPKALTNLLLDKIVGANPAALTKKIKEMASLSASVDAADLPAPSYNLEELKVLTNQRPVMVFIKGSADAPRCKFSRKMIELLEEVKVPYSTFDILTDPGVRAGLKELSNWPSYPQVYAQGKLVGGIDICQELHAEGQLKETLQGAHDGAKQQLFARLEALTKQKPVVLFMKGVPDAPECGFSSKIVELLRSQGCTDFGHVNILQDPEARQGMKEFSKWPTFPQVYANGQFIGGLDIVKEMAEEGELKEALGIN